MYRINAAAVGAAARAGVEESAKLQISDHLSRLGQRVLQLPHRGTGVLEGTENEPKLLNDLFGICRRMVTY